MNITHKTYLQLYDYLIQVMRVSKNEMNKKITQVVIGQLLEVNNSTVCRFLSDKINQSKKMLNNFTKKYPLEFQKWEPGAEKINRAITKKDCLYFLDPKKVVNRPIITIPAKIPTKQMPVGFPIQKALVINLTVNQALTVLPVSKQTKVNTPSPAIHKKIKWKRCAIPSAHIAISYRGHQSNTDARGAVFDHVRIQTLLNAPTAVVITRSLTEAHKAKTLLIDEFKDLTFHLPFGILAQNGTTYPPHLRNFADLGLLIIPGRVHKIENEPVRLEHEYKIIREAFNRGQPMLGICAGSWRIYQQLLICTKFPDRLNQFSKKFLDQALIDVSDHAYGGGMLRLNAEGKLLNNKQIHDIVIQDDSLLKSIFEKKADKKELTVNSVHWKAVNANFDKIPLNVKITALAAINPNIEIQTRQSNLMEPQEGTVEAFESIYGTPIMCFQWHPEGYEKGSSHVNALKYMALAGNAYAAKRKMLKEIEKKIDHLKKNEYSRQ